MSMGCLFFLAIAGWALGLMILTPRLKAGHALLCALCGMLFVSYYGVIVAELMAPTAYALLYGGLAMLGVGAVCAALGKRELRRRVCSVGMIAYLTLAAAGAVLLQSYVVSDHDSLSYWARIVKELFVYERFPIHADTTMHHTDYFPLLASLQYCLMRVFGWRDAYLMYVTFACALVSLAATVDLLPQKRWAAAGAVLLAYAYPLYAGALFTLRADGAFSALFPAALLCLFLRQDDQPAAWLPTFCAAAVLAGFKIYTGLMLSLALAACMLFSVPGAARKNPALRAPLLWISVAALALCLLMQFSWSGLFHFRTRLADWEAAVAAVPYTGVAFEGTPPVFSLGDFFSGNPRSASLLSALNAESLRTVGALASQTLSEYAQSRLVWVWAFLPPALAVAALSTRQKRGRIIAAVSVMLAVCAVYLLGLFGSYFVQAETAPAAMGYLGTVSVSLLWVLIALALWAAAGAKDNTGKAAIAGRAALPLMAAGMLLLFPPASFAHAAAVDTQLYSYSAMADEYYTLEIADQLLPEDEGRRALLIDCSYAASEIKSASGKEHAYQYFGMPTRVCVLQYPYADYDSLPLISEQSLTDALNYNRCDLLLLRIDDDVYWDAVQTALSLDGDWDDSNAVYDVLREDGALRFHCRLDEEASPS